MLIGYEPGLYAFLILIPFLILYLIRPRHKKLKIPSLMFLIDEKKSKTQLRFLRNILKDVLVIVQLLLLCALAFSVAEPYITLNKEETASNTVIIIDSSASSQAAYQGRTRFEESIKKASEYLQGRISIILASQVPEIVLEHGSRLEASNLLSSVKPADTITNIGAALSAAKELLEGKKGRVVVFSDFITTSPDDNTLVAKRALNANGVQVKFISTYTSAENMGITGLNINKDSFTATVKNYGEQPKEAVLRVMKDEKEINSKSIKIGAHSIEPAAFPTPTGASYVKLDAKDSFLLDNTAYISSPLGEKIKVLMLTNDRNNFLLKALEAANIFNVEIREPPIVKAFEMSHDIIIITDVIKMIVPSDVIDIKKYVESGHTLIVAANENTASLGLSEVLPVKLGKIAEATPVNIKIINAFTKDKDFGTVKKHYTAAASKDAMVIAVGDDDSPIIAEQNAKEGMLFYYGIFDKESEFKATEHYPIFWYTLLNTLLNTEDIKYYNFKLADKPQIRKAGIHEIEGKSIAFNLLDEDESDISRQPQLLEEDRNVFKEKTYAGKVRADIALWLLFGGVALVIMELLMVKWRGEF